MLQLHLWLVATKNNNPFYNYTTYCMKNVVTLVLLCFCLITAAQNEEPMDVKVKVPEMTALINKLWVNLPTNCTVPSSVTVDAGEETCAGLALKHFRYIITDCSISDGMKQAIKTEFKILKLIPVGKAAGVMLDIADLTVKALTAESPESFESDLANYGFGKIAVDNVVDKLKELLPPDVGTDVLGNLSKLYFDELWDEARKAILPDEQSYQCHPENGSCKDNIFMTLLPYTGTDPKILGRFAFDANGECACKLGCGSSPQPLLNTWSLHGEMNLVVEKAEVVEIRPHWYSLSKVKVLQIKVGTAAPTYHVQANCDCTNSNISNTVYETASAQPGNFFLGIGFVNEDAGNRFSLFGVNAAYTHPVSTTVGITGDAGVYFRKLDMINYRRIQLLAGPSLLLNNTKSKLSFSPHILAGMANTRSKYSEANADAYTNTSFAAAIGTDASMKLNQKIGAGLRVDYNPVFAKGGVVHNIRFSAGVRL